MNIRLVFLIALTWLANAATATVAAEDLGGTSLERSLARLVNLHALPLHMVVGTRRADGSCVLVLDRNFRRAADQELAAAQSRIFRELERSNIHRDIRRFNAPRTVADESLFQADAACTPIEYMPQIAEFKPPTARAVGAFKVQYPAHSYAESIEVEVVTKGKTYTLSTQRQQLPGVASELDLAAPRGPIYIGSEDLVLKWGDEILVDWSLGRWPVLRSFHLGSDTRMRVRAGGLFVETDEVITAAKGSMLAFPEGAVLTLLKYDAHGKPVTKAQVSWRQVRASRVLYSIDEHGQEHWGREPTNFEAQIVRSLRAQSRAVQPEVTLTFTAQLNAQLQGLLDKAAGAYTRLDKNSNVYGSVVMMDANSGDYIGAAGYPKAPQPHTLPGEAFVPDEKFREEFLRRRPIGSVAKAPISYAIISSTPALAGLTMQTPYRSGEQHSILGIKLDKPFRESSTPGNCKSVDFECFLKRSLNRYAATLITLAAIPQLDPNNCVDLLGNMSNQALGEESFSIVGPANTLKVSRQPSSLLWKQGRPQSAEQLLGLAWVQYAKSNFDVDVALPADTGYGAPVAHSYMWRNATVNGDMDPMSMQMVSPEKENLRLDQARNLRADYLALILGGSESMWSSTKIAETFARTITGHEIQGSFVRRDRPTNWANLDGAHDDRIVEARSHYLAGLKAVFVSGTGEAFGPNVAQLMRKAQAAKLELSVYAKSGTPTIEELQIDDDADDDRHPIDSAFRNGVLSAEQSSQGLRIYLRGELVTPQLLESVELDASPPLTRQHLRYLAVFNSLDAELKALMCASEGARLRCEWPRRERNARVRLGTGRNYVVYAWLRDPTDGRTCRAISMAVSFSTKKGDAFKRMMNELLEPSQGPLSRALGLSDADKQVECGHAA